MRESGATYAPHPNICHMPSRYFVSWVPTYVNRPLLQVSILIRHCEAAFDNEFNHGEVGDAICVHLLQGNDHKGIFVSLDITKKEYSYEFMAKFSLISMVGI